MVGDGLKAFSRVVAENSLRRMVFQRFFYALRRTMPSCICRFPLRGNLGIALYLSLPPLLLERGWIFMSPGSVLVQDSGYLQYYTESSNVHDE